MQEESNNQLQKAYNLIDSKVKANIEIVLKIYKSNYKEELPLIYDRIFEIIQNLYCDCFELKDKANNDKIKWLGGSLSEKPKPELQKNMVESARLYASAFKELIEFNDILREVEVSLGKDIKRLGLTFKEGGIVYKNEKVINDGLKCIGAQVKNLMPKK